jgi:PKHD-type hydroxylase
MPQNPASPPLFHMTDYVVIPRLFTPEECDEITYMPLPASQAQVIRFAKTSFSQLELEQRNTKVKAVPKEARFAWVYERIAENVKIINQNYYHFQFSNITSLQILEYENTGFYNVHVDIGTGKTSLRKLSVVVFLSDPQDYEGGELILKPNYPILEQAKGSAVFFPSYIPHEIRPVTAGLRHTMVTWITGPCFK